MKHMLKLILLSIGLLAAIPAFAGNPGNELGQCMVDALNGKERKDLAKWIFFSMGTHPELKPYLKADTTQVNNSDKFIGHLVTRLLTVDCPAQLSAAYKANPAAVKQAFGLVGRVAMQELMTNENVMKALTNYMHYADQKKIESVLTK